MIIYSDAADIMAEQVRETGLPEELCPILNRLNYSRRGWLKRNVHEQNTVESALQHTAKLALAASAVNPEKWGLNSLALRQQCIVHEIPEILGTDWMPGEISLAEKARLEEQQMLEILPKEFPERQKILDIWTDFETQHGLAFFLDKMDAAVTADYYAVVDRKYVPVAEEFHQYACSKVQDETLRRILKTVHVGSLATRRKLAPTDVFPFYFEQLAGC